MRKKLSKILLTDVAEQIKPVYKTNCSRKKNFDRRIQTSVPKKVFFQKGKFFSQKIKTSRFGTKQVEKVYRRTPPYLACIGDSIDQGGSYAPRGVIDQYICLQMGAPFFSLLYYRHKLKKFVKLFSVKANRIYIKKLPKTFQICSSQLFTFVV